MDAIMNRFLNRASPSIFASLVILMMTMNGCEGNSSSATHADDKFPDFRVQFDTELLTQIYTADPSAHVFEDAIYVYPSHDIESGIERSADGARFAMRDYRVISINPKGEVTLHEEALSLDSIAWAKKQLWAPDAAYKNGKYYLYFPAKDEQDIFRVGVAMSDTPSGPFIAQAEPIKDVYSIDPAVFADTDGSYYLYVGGIWGGQLQRWQMGHYSPHDTYPNDDEPALMPKVAMLSNDMLSIEGQLQDVVLLNKDGSPLKAGDNQKRFFEAAWVHKYQGKYYFSYSTGDTHKIAYAVGDNPMGPFVYQGVVLNPVVGWTNHHSIVEYAGQWYLFYHDSKLSKGQTHLRSVKMTKLTHLADGSIETIEPYPIN
ncbi:glycoside hydrolase family 43 protein [Aliiglaciecola lipolytica]|nr:glycoside hydrolase family 43 protein [Aliiglaciecola lipolytica]